MVRKYQRKSNIKFLRIFSCPECNYKKKPFDSIMGLNVHLRRFHKTDYRIELNSKGRALPRGIKLVPVLITN